MKYWIIALVVLVAGGVPRVLAARSGWNRSGHNRRVTGRIEKNLHVLAKQVREVQQQRQEDGRMLHALASAQVDIQLVKTTLAALEVESRALSQLDLQFRNLHNALQLLADRKSQQTQLCQSFRQELQLVKYGYLRNADAAVDFNCSFLFIQVNLS